MSTATEPLVAVEELVLTRAQQIINDYGIDDFEALFLANNAVDGLLRSVVNCDVVNSLKNAVPHPRYIHPEIADYIDTGVIE